MKTQASFKRLIRQAVLRKVSPMVIRVLAVPDYLNLARFDEVFRTISRLGWPGVQLPHPRDHQGVHLKPGANESHRRLLGERSPVVIEPVTC
jgi:hypothetical protein